MKAIPSPTNLTLLAMLVLPLVSESAEVGGIDIHGAVSVTASTSDTYNYLGKTDDEIDFNNIELTLNGQYLFDNGIRVGAQVYAYETAGYDEITLDYASVSYDFTDWFGLSLGRNKLPLGLYNASQDVDFVHPFVNLPLTYYRKSLRPLVNAYDGMGARGALALGALGALDYNVYLGRAQNPTGDSLLARELENGTYFEVDSWDSGATWGGAVFWSTPLDGLRVGFSYVWFPDSEVTSTILTAEEVALIPSDSRVLPQTPELGGPAGWNAFLAGTRSAMEADFKLWSVSAEYLGDRFTVAAEYRRTVIDAYISDGLVGTAESDSEDEAFYLLGSYRLSEKWEVGAYASFYFNDVNNRDGEDRRFTPDHRSWQYDYAISAKYQILEYWLVKAELHYLNGTANLLNTDGQNEDPSDWDEEWFYAAMKTTFHF